MSARNNQELGREFFESQDRRRGLIDSTHCAPDYIARIGSHPVMTRDEHEAFAKAFFSAFPDMHHVVHDAVADEHKVVVRFSLGGTHDGEFMGIPPTGKRFDVEAIAILKVEDGRVSELHGQFDQLGLLKQLGVM